MKIKVSEASGHALDWMVAKALWGNVTVSSFGPLFGKGVKAPCVKNRAVRFKPSSDWAQGGPIIEREKISPKWHESDESWSAYSYSFFGAGRTPLIAAMRCYVASKFGDEVDVPQELV